MVVDGLADPRRGPERTDGRATRRWARHGLRIGTGEHPRPYVHVDLGAESRLGLDRPARLAPDRWALTRQMRCEIILSALDLCGYGITSECKLLTRFR